MIEKIKSGFWQGWAVVLSSFVKTVLLWILISRWFLFLFVLDGALAIIVARLAASHDHLMENLK